MDEEQVATASVSAFPSRLVQDVAALVQEAGIPVWLPQPWPDEFQVVRCSLGSTQSGSGTYTVIAESSDGREFSVSGRFRGATGRPDGTAAAVLPGSAHPADVSHTDGDSMIRIDTGEMIIAVHARGMSARDAERIAASVAVAP